MILHAIHAEKTFGESGIKSRIIVKSPDTDVLILCIHYFPSMQHTQVLWFHKGSITNTKDGRFHAFPYIRSVASSILFYVTFYQLHMPSQDVIPHHPCSGSANEPFFKVLKDSPENFRDLSILSDCDTDDTIDAARKLVCRLYDQKGKLKEDHVDFNKLRVRLATLRDACLAKLPPCEATFTQHVWRSSLQISIWMTAHVAKPPMKSAVLFGWEDRNGLVRLFQRSDVFQFFARPCLYLQRKICVHERMHLFLAKSICTDLCPCQAGDLCHNENTHLAISRNTDEDDDI
jgi:hypothetical protein